MYLGLYIQFNILIIYGGNQISTLKKRNKSKKEKNYEKEKK